MRVYQCEDSLEGVSTAIYRAYEEHAEHRETWIRVDRELMLFGEYIPVETDLERAEKVLRTLRRRFGQEDYQSLCMALVTPHPEKAQAVYPQHPPADIPYGKIFLWKTVREVHHQIGQYMVRKLILRI